MTGRRSPARFRCAHIGSRPRWGPAGLLEGPAHSGGVLMLSAVKKRATFANICSFLCLTIVLGMGTAYAKNTVRSSDIVNGQVKTVDLANNGVTSAKIQDVVVGSAEVTDNSLVATDLAFDSVGADELQ